MKRVIAFVLSALALAGCSVPTAPDNAEVKTARAKAALEGATKSTPGVSTKLATN